MPVGVALSELRRQLRAEVGQTLNPAQGVNAQAQYDMALSRQQLELWTAYEWPHLHYWSDVELAAGQQLYDYPPDMPFDNINRVWVLSGSTNWLPIQYGISMVEYQQIGGEATRGFPTTRWQNRVKIINGSVIPAGQIEVLPIPDRATKMRLEGQATCNSLVGDTDIAVLDSTLIVLFAAAEILAAQKAENASLKLQKAQQYLRRLLANQGADKRKITVLGGGSMWNMGVTPEERFRIPVS